MELELTCVADFLVVLEENSFRRAAERQHLSPPALSRRIRRLEQQVGVSLLQRGPAGTGGPTAAGLAFAAAAGALLEAARAARALAQAAAPPPLRRRTPIAVSAGAAGTPSSAALGLGVGREHDLLAESLAV